MSQLLKLHKFPSPCLSEVCEPVPRGQGCDELLDAMWSILRQHRAYGLAASQLGVMQRVIVCKVDAWVLEVINPVIVWEHKSRLVLGNEGCLSFPGQRIQIYRNRWVKIDGFDRDWKPLRVGAKDVRGRVIQHEIDHLNGITMPDRLRMQAPQ